MQNFFKRLKILLSAELQFKLPKKCQILFFDEVKEKNLKKYFDKYTTETFFLRGEKLNIPCILLSLFFKGKFLDRYLKAFIKFSNPKIILTLLDNNSFFYSLSKKYPKVKTIFIQNGWRAKYLDVFHELENQSEQNKSYFVDYKFVFGEAYAKKFSNFIRGKNINFGSFKNNSSEILFHKKLNIISYTSFFDLTWAFDFYAKDRVFKIQNKNLSLTEFSIKPDKFILSFLSKYAKSKNMDLFIIPRSRKKSTFFRQAENAYYKNIIGVEAKFLDLDSDYPSYNALDVSRINVTMDSTLGYECLARQNKTAFFSIRGTINNINDYSVFGWPMSFEDTGFFWTNKPDYKIFKEIMDNLLYASKEVWHEQLKINKVDNLIIRNKVSKLINLIDRVLNN